MVGRNVGTLSHIGRVICLLVAGLGIGGCVLAELNLEGRGCPCVGGYVCVDAVCVPQGSVVADGGVSFDAGVDAEVPVDSGMPDTGAADSGTDGGEGPDSGTDGGEGPDTGAPDTGTDGGDVPDTGIPDTGVGDSGPVDSGPVTVPCSTDRHCTAPGTVCEGGVCTMACNAGGPACTGGLSCDTTTGHCFNGGSACTTDTQCGSGPPVGVCVAGACRYGCAASLVAACEGDRVCASSGFCTVAPTCTVSADCGRPDFVCQGTACVRRCDEPGAYGCNGNSSCNASTGLCAGGVAVGQDCTFDGDCISGECLSITSPSAQTFCTRACGATSDCPLDTSCLPVDGATLCVRENVFAPRPQMDTLSGGACSNPGNSCQSLLCTASVCVERCSQDAHCQAYGTQCVSVGTGASYLHACGAPVGAVAAGDVCANDNNALCQSGVCNRYFNRCAAGCCADADCGPSESCLVYDFEPDRPITTCQPRSSSAGTKAVGVACGASSECDSENCAPRDPQNLGGAKACTTHCCTDADCAGYPQGARCATMPASGVAALAKYCVPLSP